MDLSYAHADREARVDSISPDVAEPVFSTRKPSRYFLHEILLHQGDELFRKLPAMDSMPVRMPCVPFLQSVIQGPDERTEQRMQRKESWLGSLDLSSIGRELGVSRSRTLRGALAAAFALAGMVGAGSASAQGGICLSDCGDGSGQTLSPINVTAFAGSWNPCAGGWCDNGGGNDVPPDESGAGGSGSGGSGDGSGGSGKIKMRGYDSTNTCAVMEEHRLASANYLAHGNVRGARRGDYVDVLLSDGMVERWQYICGGPFCAGTIINNSPVHSMCNRDWNWVPFADWEPPSP